MKTWFVCVGPRYSMLQMKDPARLRGDEGAFATSCCECGGIIVHVSGCRQCMACGNSKCDG